MVSNMKSDVPSTFQSLLPSYRARTRTVRLVLLFLSGPVWGARASSPYRNKLESASTIVPPPRGGTGSASDLRTRREPAGKEPGRDVPPPSKVSIHTSVTCLLSPVSQESSRSCLSHRAFLRSGRTAEKMTLFFAQELSRGCFKTSCS